MILIAIGASFQSLRKGNEKLRDRIDAQGKETSEQMAQLRERMVKLEGLLEGLREAITGVPGMTPVRAAHWTELCDAGLQALDATAP